MIPHWVFYGGLLLVHTCLAFAIGWIGHEIYASRCQPRRARKSPKPSTTCPLPPLGKTNFILTKCLRCDGTKQVCSACFKSDKRCKCLSHQLSTPMPCPACTPAPVATMMKGKRELAR